MEEQLIESMAENNLLQTDPTKYYQVKIIKKWVDFSIPRCLAGFSASKKKNSGLKQKIKRNYVSLFWK